MKLTNILILCVLAMSLLPAAGSAKDGWRVLDGHPWCEDGQQGDKLCEIREITLTDRATLRLDGAANGGIQVEGWDRDEVRIRAKVSVWSKDADKAREIVGKIRIETDGRTVRAVGPDLSNWNKRSGWSVSYRVKVPRQMDLDLTTVNGGIGIDGVAGEIEFSAVNGGISLQKLAGDVRGRTTNGGVTVQLSGDEWSGDGLDVSTTNGGVTVAVPQDYNAEFETGTTNGNLHVDFPITVQGNIKKKIRTTLGKGGSTVRVKTTNGGVRIKRVGT